MDQVIRDYESLMEDLAALLERLNSLRVRVQDESVAEEINREMIRISQAFEVLKEQLEALKNRP